MIYVGYENLQQLNINQTLVSWYTAHIEVWTRYIWCKASEVCLYSPLTMTSPFLVENLIWMSGLRHYQAMIVAVPFNHSQDNICKLNICLISPGPKCAQTREINRLWWESNQLWRWLGYMSMPNLTSFLPCALQKMSGNPTVDSFFLVKIVPKLGKQSADHGQHLISSDGDQNTSTYRIRGHSFHALSRQYLKPPNLTLYPKSKLCQN